jgi:Zn ribbon nucleic-acid-binding protein
VAAYKLLLYPQDPDCAPVDPAVLADDLQDIGFIAAPVTVPDGVFYPAGAQFLQLLSFLGCSPAIELDPPADPAALAAARASGSFCHVYLSSRGRLQLRADPRTPAPRCPACRQPEKDWRLHINAWRENPAMTAWTCRNCGYSGRLTDLQFRKTAAFSRTWVEVRGIYPSEAVPGDALLARLRTLSGCQWQYSYLQE